MTDLANKVSQLLRSIGQTALASQIEQSIVGNGFRISTFPVQVTDGPVGGNRTLSDIFGNAVNAGSYPALAADLANPATTQAYFFGTVVKISGSSNGTQARYGLKFGAGTFRPAHNNTSNLAFDSDSPIILINRVEISGGSSAYSMVGYVLTVKPS